MKNNKQHIVETFNEWLESKYNSEPIDEYNQTERFDKLAETDPKKFKKLNNNFKWIASKQKISKGNYNKPRYITNDGNNKYANKIKQLSGKPKVSIFKESPISRNRNSIDENINEGYDYAAITLGIGILNSTENENYNFIYEHINQELIDECLDATYEYLNDYKLNTDDVDYCIECLIDWLEKQKNIENGVLDECEKIKQFIRNKPILW